MGGTTAGVIREENEMGNKSVSRALRARRMSAEQGNPGGASRRCKDHKGGVLMGKNVFGKFKNIVPAALVLMGWCFFIGGIIAQGCPFAQIVLLAAARVLP